MGLCFVALVEGRRPSAAQAIRSDSLSRPAPSARFNQMRFLVPGAEGAVWEDFLGASSVCLLAAARA